MPDAIEILTQDHRAVEALLAEFDESGDRDVALQICTELALHADLEEELVYPLLRTDVDDGDALADEAVSEHDEVRRLVDEIRSCTDDDELVDLVDSLAEAVQHHVAEEEGEAFPKLRDAVPANELDRIGGELTERKAAGSRAG